MVFDTEGTYVATDAVFSHSATHEWNHGLGEIITALLAAGLVDYRPREHDSVPWEALPGKMERLGGGEWRLADDPSRLPHTYTLQAVKRLSVPAAFADAGDADDYLAVAGRRRTGSSQSGRRSRASTTPGGTSSRGPKKLANSATEWL